jgi:arylsulfatase
MGRGVPAELTFWINGKEATKGTVERTIPLIFTASETFDVGMDLNSPVADAYFDKGSFPFEGSLKKLHFAYLKE